MSSRPLVTCVGEAIVDLISMRAGTRLRDAPSFLKMAGGAGANVAVGLAKLGVLSAFVGKVGRDSFGQFLLGQLRGAGVDIRGVIVDPSRGTRHALVSLATGGDREFEFCERHPADESISLQDMDLGRILRSRIVHLSSFLLLREPARSAVRRLARLAADAGCLISFDPNLRPRLWSSTNALRFETMRLAERATILRLNREEAAFLVRSADPVRAGNILLALGPQLVVITDGARGCYALTPAGGTFVNGFRVHAVDTTGCGDAFLAGLLAKIASSQKAPAAMAEQDLVSVAEFANAVGALAARRHGAVDSFPMLQDVRRFLAASKGGKSS